VADGWAGAQPKGRHHKKLGPVPSKYRPYPGRRSGLATVVALVLIVAIAGAAAWQFVLKPKSAWPAHWDPRVASIAAFVQTHAAVTWKHPVRIVFESKAAFAVDAAAAPAGPSPQGASVARYVPADATVYVNGTAVNVYAKVALTGQLTEALEAQYLSSASPAIDREAAKVQAAMIQSLPATQAALLLQQTPRG
jgi:hypothetical protein